MVVSKIEITFLAVCWVIASYFAGVALWPFFPPPNITENGDYVLLLLAVFFAVVPVAQKVEIFKFLTFETRLGKIQEKQAQQDTEIKHLQTVQATLTNSLSSVNSNSNQATYNSYYGEIRQEALTAVNLPDDPKLRVQAIVDAEPDSEFFGLGPEHVGPDADERDPHFNLYTRMIRSLSDKPRQSLMNTGVDLQSELRIAIGKRVTGHTPRTDAKFLTANQLWSRFVELYPATQHLVPSFEYFFNIFNAVSHGQLLPETDIGAAAAIGLRLRQEVSKYPALPRNG